MHLLDSFFIRLPPFFILALRRRYMPILYILLYKDMYIHSTKKTVNSIEYSDPIFHDFNSSTIDGMRTVFKCSVSLRRGHIGDETVKAKQK